MVKKRIESAYSLDDISSNSPSNPEVEPGPTHSLNFPGSMV